MTAPSRVTRGARAIIEIYLSREASARYDWRLAIGTVFVVGAPMLAAVLAGRTDDGVLTSLAAWFTALAVPEPSWQARVRQLAVRCSLLTAATAVGPRIRTGWMSRASMASFISRASIFLPRYSGVRPTIRPAMKTATMM